MAHIKINISPAPGILEYITIQDDELLKAINHWDADDRHRFMIGINSESCVQCTKVIASIINKIQVQNITKQQAIIIYLALQQLIEKLQHIIKS